MNRFYRQADEQTDVHTQTWKHTGTLLSLTDTHSQADRERQMNK